MARLSPPGALTFLLVVVGLLALPGLAEADPFTEMLIALPFPDSRDVAVADFNGDGLPDIAALSSYGPFVTECYPPPGPITCGGQMRLTVALNLGSAFFAPVLAAPAMCAPWAVAAADFNADGHVDVMIGNRGARDAFGICSQASVSFYPGAGNGGFGTAQHLIVPYPPVDVAAGDFDGDGIPEAAVAQDSPGGVTIYRVSAAGDLGADASWNAGGALAALASGDLDGDSDDEIVAAANDTYTIFILDLDGAGDLVEQEACALFAFGPLPRGLAIANLVGDSANEIAVGRPGASLSDLTLLVRGGSGSYCDLSDAVNSSIDGTYGGQLAAAQLDLDGIPDLATTDGAWHVRTLLGDGAGHFVASSPIATDGYSDDVVASDFNGDGLDDLALSGFRVFLATGAALAMINDTPTSDTLGLVMSKGAIDWNGVFGAASYDVVRGDLGILHPSGGDFTAAVEACVVSDAATTAVEIQDDPPAGTGWWILARPNDGAGAGTYDAWGSSQVGLRDAEIDASSQSCP